MQLQKILYYFLFTAVVMACNTQPKAEEKKEPVIKEENVSYPGDDVTLNGYIAYDENDTSKRPAVLVIHEWWGLNEYPKMRARELAKLGYVAMAADVYGNGMQAETPDSAGKAAMPFYENPLMAKQRIEAAIQKLKSIPYVDTSNIAAIGYCFGGGILLNTVRLGAPQLKGVVSFHGSLIGVPANKDLLQSRILVCHGADDKFVTMNDVEQFKHQMDSIGAKYTVKVYDNATHAFTNPNATATGQKYNIPIAYNAAADSASWNDMKTFFAELFK